MIRLLATSFVLLAGFAIASAQSPTPLPGSTDPCAEITTRATRAEARLQDWPTLARYREANSASAAPGNDERRVVFIGDSITDSWDDTKRFSGFFPGKSYINRGISGQTTPQMLIRFRPDVIALHPKVVVILAGTNDLAGNTGPTTLSAIEDNLTSMFELAQANGIRVVLASVLPISDYEKNKDGQQIIRTKQRPPEQIIALNEWIKKYATTHGGIYLDYFAAMADDKGFLKEELTEDGLHPNQKGYDVMAPLADKAIAAALRSPR
jgi:lysophospholipase L1-like esterase